MKVNEILAEFDADQAYKQTVDAFQKTQQRQQFYGRTPDEIQGDPSEIGDTWDDYKQHVKTFGKLPKTPKMYDPSKDDPKAVPLDPDKLQKPKFVPGQHDPWDTDSNIDTVG